MPKAKNIAVVASLKEKFSRAKSLVLADYRGLTHKQLEDLHKRLRAMGGEFIVVKNSLLKIASHNTKYIIHNTSLTGPTAALFSYEDELAPLSELAKFIRSFASLPAGRQVPKIKLGIINSIVYDEKQVAAIAALPAREVLYRHVVSGLSRPLYGLVYALNGNLQKLAYILTQIKK